MKVEGYTTGSRQADISLSWNGGTDYTNGSGLKTTNVHLDNSFPYTDNTITLGNSSDKWNRTWASTDFSNSNFRVKLDATSGGGSTLYVDHVQAKVTYTFDTTPPAVDITFPTAGLKVDGTEAVTFTDSEVTSPQCSVDNVHWVACTSGATTLSSITGFNSLPAGAFTLYVKDTDSAGNTGSDSEAGIIKLMCVTGHNGNNFSNDSSIGTVSWSHPERAQTNNGQYTTATLNASSEATNYLKATKFGFNIPAGSTIEGIKVLVERKEYSSMSSILRVLDNSVRLVDNTGAIVASSEKSTGTLWPNSDTAIIYGGATDKWGQSWTSANVNSQNMGFVISAIHEGSSSYSRDLSVDYIEMTVCYSGDSVPPVIGSITINPSSGTSPKYISGTSDISAAVTEDNSVASCEYTIDGGTHWHPALYVGGLCMASGVNTSAATSINMRATDGAGNTGTGTAVAVTVDTVKPVTGISVSPADPNGDNDWYTSDITFTLNATDTGMGVANTYYILNAGPPVAYSGAVTISTEGVTSIGYYSTDNAGNTETTNWKSVKLDKTKPVVPTLNLFAADYIGSASETVSWTAASDATSGLSHYNVYRDIDGAGSPSLIGSTANTWVIDSGLEDGKEYSYYVTSVDNAGLESINSNSDGFIVDLSSPSDPVLSALPAYVSNGGTVDLSWSASVDLGSGVDHYDLDKDGSDASVGNVTSYSDAGNSDATSHSYKVMAEDGVGNDSNWSNTETTTIDLSPPSTLFGISPTVPSSGWYNTPVTVTLTASDSGAGVQYTKYCIDSTDSCDPASGTTYTGPFVVSSEGDNYVRFYSVDNVGNDETPQSSGLFQIDLSSPYGQSIELDGGAPYNNTGSVTATLVTGSDDLSGVDYCEVSWDSGANWTNVGLAPSAGPQSYPEGTAVAQYRCYDVAGNASSIVQDDIIVDLSPPVSEITTPMGTEVVTKGKILIQGTASDNLSGISKVQIKVLDGEGNTVQDWMDATGTDVWSFYWDASSLANGTYTVKSSATDGAGLVEPDDNVSFVMMSNMGPYLSNVYYENGGLKFVRIFGFLDLAGIGYDVDVIDTSAGLDSAPLYTYSVVTDDNAFFAQDVGVDAWDLSKIYAARTTLGNGTKIYSTLDTLYILYLQSEIDDLSARLDFADANIAALWQTAQDLNAADQALQAQIDALNLRVDDLNGEIIVIQGQISDMNTEINEIQAHLALVDSNITAIWGEISDIRAILSRMNHGTLYLSYDHDRDNGWLRVKGEAPEGTATVKIKVLTVDQETYDRPISVTPNSNNEYGYNFTDVNDWDPQIYEVQAVFRDAGNNTIGQSVNVQFYALQELMQFQGFSFQSDWIKEYCYVRPNYLPVSFNFGAVETGQYDFNVIATDGVTTINEGIYSSYLMKFASRAVSATFDVPNDGNWAVTLVAHNTWTGSITYSNNYNVYVVDDCGSLFTQSVNYVSPVTNSDMTLPWPFGSIKDNVFWTQSGDFSVNAFLNSNNKILGQTCQFKYRNSDSQLMGISNEADVVTVDGQNGACVITATTAWWNSQNKISNSTSFSTYALFSGAQESALIEVGVDDTPPTIAEIIPSIGMYAGIMHIDVNAFDDLSGISHVDLEIIDKNTGIVKLSVPSISFNMGTELFYADVNTLDVNADGDRILPDGTYNIKAYAYDIAGNSSALTVDPGVDNTKPKINGVVISQNPILRGSNLVIDVNASDNLSGVGAVAAKLVESSTGNIVANIPLVLTSGTPLSGIWEGTINTATAWNIGLYTLTVDANDSALPVPNSADSVVRDVNVFRNYSFNLVLDPSTLTAGQSGVIRGQLVDDNNNPIADANVIVASPFFGPVVLNTDTNGDFNASFTTGSNGTFDFNAVFSDENAVYVAHATLTVNNPSSPSPPSGGPGGGISPSTTPEGTEVPLEEIVIPEVPSPPIGPAPETAPPSGGEEAAPPAETTPPAGPTGFFGLGANVETLGIGALVVILICGVVYFLRKKKKK